MDKLSDNPTPQEVKDYYDLHTGEGTINFTNDECSLDLWHALNQACKYIAQLEAKAKDMELMATDAMDRYSDAVDKYTAEITQLEAECEAWKKPIVCHWCLEHQK